MAYYSRTPVERVADELSKLTYSEMMDLMERLCDGVTEALSEDDEGNAIIDLNELAKAFSDWANGMNTGVAAKQKETA